MSGAPEPLLLDTNIVILLARNNARGQWIEAHYHLRARPERPLISVVTVGEALALARQWRWGEARTLQLEEALRSLVILDIHTPAVLGNYAEIAAYLRDAGYAMGQNDIWIAATAMATGALLVTTDRDFDALDPTFIRREWVDPRMDITAP